MFKKISELQETTTLDDNSLLPVVKSGSTQKITFENLKEAIGGDLSGYEKVENKVTSLSSSSTDTQYPSAKCVYDLIGDLEAILETLDTGSGV